MKHHDIRGLVLTFVLAAGCGYNPKASTSGTGEAGVPPAQGGAGGTSPALDAGEAGETGKAGTSGSTLTGTAGTAGSTGPDDAGARTPAETGGTVATSSARGGSMVTLDAWPQASPDVWPQASPDASPDRPSDVPVTVTCPRPQTPTNGAVDAPSLAVGGVATYTCDPGYGTPTLASRQCQGDGTWSGSEPLCKPVDCGPPPSVANTKVDAPSTTYNATAKYTCDTGTSPSASTVLTCQSTGRWTAVTFVCDPVDCGAPPKLDNGLVSAPSTTYNTVASYSCSQGFSLSGLDQRTCQANGAWSGAAPTCQAITPRLTIHKTGSGLGTVTSSPSTAINCGTTCTATFAYNSSVTLTATAESGQSFVGWDSQACTGKTACTIPMTKDTEVNAIFSPPANIMFVTSTWHTPNLGGLAGADEICAARAAAGSLAGRYVAWLSTSTVNAKDRVGSASGWVRPDGKPVLNQIKDIESDKLFYPPSLDELGQRAEELRMNVMTGTGKNAALFVGTTTTTCGDWTSEVDEPQKWFTVGTAGSGSAAFTNDGGFQCNMKARLYCMGVDRTAFVAPDALQGRRAFTSETQWASGAGIETADAVCQKEAAAAGLSGTFRALLSPTGASAASRFEGSAPWYRMDGLALASSAAAFFSDKLIDVGPNQTAKGVYLPGDVRHWIGGKAMGAVGTSDLNCNNWKSKLATDNATIGFSDSNIAYNLSGGDGTFTIPCDYSYHLVCLQTP
jgi:hypothetical protein